MCVCKKGCGGLTENPSWPQECLSNTCIRFPWPRLANWQCSFIDTSHINSAQGCTHADTHIKGYTSKDIHLLASNLDLSTKHTETWIILDIDSESNNSLKVTLLLRIIATVLFWVADLSGGTPPTPHYSIIQMLVRHMLAATVYRYDLAHNCKLFLLIR